MWFGYNILGTIYMNTGVGDEDVDSKWSYSLGLVIFVEQSAATGELE
jgi:hypothetical protein